jgi:hypothetical protein
MRLSFEANAPTRTQWVIIHKKRHNELRYSGYTVSGYIRRENHCLLGRWQFLS